MQDDLAGQTFTVTFTFEVLLDASEKPECVAGLLELLRREVNRPTLRYADLYDPQARALGIAGTLKGQLGFGALEGYCVTHKIAFERRAIPLDDLGEPGVIVRYRPEWGMFNRRLTADGTELVPAADIEHVLARPERQGRVSAEAIRHVLGPYVPELPPANWPQVTRADALALATAGTPFPATTAPAGLAGANTAC
jgi:hypothetical protein